MSAIVNSHLIDIVAVAHASGISRKTGQPWDMYRAQCVVTGPDKGVRIGQLLLPNTLKETRPGKYLAEIGLDVNWECEVVPVVIGLHPYGAKPTGKEAAGEAAKA
ncbi:MULTISPECIES: hypothetical protein [unclassified Herbaspirillum]|uniref:hypothetical protein n=1 Tax=unclassified Herbaspirillum TaxID=2624150 RepID=UPI001152ED39|nr:MULTISPECIES: hypothetical protein [unclassified Herbaspirillum]MBB5391288.1 hypothetical protein [Herbaspirillum sp. SJZ102]TQK13025.1 hypothetical protein FB599_0433 [Herbaspirillum sp. SJZ130]TQK15029.1 hypothetical protein FB598_0371 [Herbaspirillum sp. SJZ106]TWC67386.1 hypothetical protein FB597_104197 [Herbaspirillum sp. SJZ099]